VADIGEAAFGPEESETYELGFKSQFFDHRVQTNVAVFWTDYTGIQLQIQEGASPVSQNAGDAELKGAELEMEAILGGGFSLNLAAGYIDAEYTEVKTSVQGITLDTDLPKTPEYKFTVSPQWDVNLSNAGKLRFAVDYTKTASMFNDAPNTPLLARPSTDNLAASIAYYSPEEKYVVTLGGSNLTDDRYLVVGSVNGAEGETVGTYNPPRQWYLGLRMRFE
jgi:iron complex outermembrane receptor protein